MTASLWRRFLAYTIDFILLITLFNLIGIEFWFMEKLPNETIFAGIYVNIYALLLTVAYFIGCHINFQATLGKFLMGIKVSSKGEPPLLPQVFIKEILSIRYVPFWYAITPDGVITLGSTFINNESAIVVTVCIGLYFLVQNGFVFFNQQNKTLADFIARTQVINRAGIALKESY